MHILEFTKCGHIDHELLNVKIFSIEKNIENRKQVYFGTLDIVGKPSIKRGARNFPSHGLHL